MTLDRRSFLRFSTATILGLQGASLSQESPRSPNVLARPRSRSRVRNGHHPIHPERVVVMTANGGDGWSDRDRRLEGSLRTSLSKPLTYHAGGVRSVTCLLPERKLDLCFRLMRVLTDYYRMPHLFPAWATGLAKREALGSTGINHGFGLLHQFQDDSMVELINPPTDWWLVLFPGGIEWGAFDGKPVFGMIGHVFPPNHRKTPGLTMRTWELVSRVGQSMDADAWSRLAKLDRLTAAQLVNRATQLAIRSTCYA